MPQIIACLEVFSAKCRGLLSEYLFLKLLSFSERSVVWTPKTCVMVEVWLNRLNSAAGLWNLGNWVVHMDVRLGFGLSWLRKFIPKRPCAFGTWIDRSLLALTAFKRKSWKRWKPQSISSRALAPHCSAARAASPPSLAGMDVLSCGVCESRAFPGKCSPSWGRADCACMQYSRCWAEVWGGEIQPIQCWNSFQMDWWKILLLERDHDFILAWTSYQIVQSYLANG